MCFIVLLYPCQGSTRLNKTPGRRELLDLSLAAVRHSSSKGLLPSEAEVAPGDGLRWYKDVQRCVSIPRIEVFTVMACHGFELNTIDVLAFRCPTSPWCKKTGSIQEKLLRFLMSGASEAADGNP